MLKLPAFPKESGACETKLLSEVINPSKQLSVYVSVCVVCARRICLCLIIGSMK